MKLKCICGYECDRNGDLIYHIDSDRKHRDQTGSQLYELILAINITIHKIDKKKETDSYPESIFDDRLLQELKSLLNSSSLTKNTTENP